MTVADAFGFTDENAPGFTAFAISNDRLYRHFDKEKRPMFIAEVDGITMRILFIARSGEWRMRTDQSRSSARIPAQGPGQAAVGAFVCHRP